MHYEALKSGVIYHNSTGQKFIEQMKKEYDLEIITFDYWFTKGAFHDFQLGISMHMNLRDRNSEISSSLYGRVGSNMLCGNSIWSKGIGSDKVESKEIQTIGNVIINKFLDTHHYRQEDIPEIYLSVYDFVASALSYAYGNSVLPLRDKMSRKYHLDPYVVYVFGEPIVSLLLDDERLYHKLLKRKDEIRRDCYNIIKEKDKFNFITEKTTEVKLLLKSEIDQEHLAGLLQNW